MKTFFLRLCFLLLSFSCALQAEEAADKTVLLAVLAKNKAHVLPAYLRSIDNLDYDKKLITVYINTNNNQDSTKELLDAWVEKNGAQYRSIIMESHEVAGASITKPHEWTAERFKVLATIRNKSMQKALEANCDYYFVVDCDNFISPCTLKELIAKNKPIIAPMLRAVPEPCDAYSNYFCDISETGYYKDHPNYRKILYREMTGTFQVPVVHCTYLIQAPYINKLNYIDNTNDYEFVIFSRGAREKGIEQYICNEKDFGTLLHFYSEEMTLAEEAARVATIPGLQERSGNKLLANVRRDAEQQQEKGQRE